MCIRHHIHRLYCDSRSLVTIAQETPQGRRTTKTYVNPYEPPHRCEHDHLKTPETCPVHGCCWVKTIDLPCDCADKPSCKSWGRGDNEDITQCLHFRDYHEYVYKTTPLIEAKKKQACLVEPNVPKKPWEGMKLPYLDSWVTNNLVDKNQPDVPGEFFCEDNNFRLWRLHVIFKGEALFAEMKRLDWAWHGGVSEGKWKGIEIEVQKAWDELYKVQCQGWKWYLARAKGFLGVCPNK